MTEGGPAAGVGRRIAARYRAIAEGPMAGLPVCNPALGVADVGFRAHRERAVGIIISTWFMNVVAAQLPGAAPAPAAAAGATVMLALPGGDVAMIVGDLPAFGRLDACSLFSPMQDFAGMDAALEAARAAIAELFAPAREAAGTATPYDRRAILRGRFGAPPAAR